MGALFVLIHGAVKSIFCASIEFYTYVGLSVFEFILISYISVFYLLGFII